MGETLNKKIVYGSQVVVNPDLVIHGGALYVENGRIVDFGSYSEIKQRYRCDNEIGSNEHIVLPGFINAHNHGKGLTDFQRGQLDDTLETWKFRSYPTVDPVLDTKWAAIKQLEAGITTTMHNHDLNNPNNYEKEFFDIVEAYKESKMKVAFAPTIANRNQFVYGDNEAFVDSLPEDLQVICRARIDHSKIFGPKEYLHSVAALHSAYQHDPQVKIMHGPISPQWVDEETLRAIRKDASEKGLRIHIHVQQTKLQNLYGYKKYGRSLIAYLDSIGFLDKSVTLGHAVWISEEDIRLLAARRVSTTHHGSCNFRVRNGISPVYPLLKAGVHVAVGLDDKEFGDNKDYLEELRLISKLHRLPDHRLDSPHLLPKDVFRMASQYGAEVLGWQPQIGTLEEGSQADIVLLDQRRISEPFVSPTQSVIDLLLYRAGSQDVDMVLVDGELVVRGGKVIHMDREAVVQALADSLLADYEADLEIRNKEFRVLRSHIADWFSGWYDQMDEFEGSPFYHLNNK
ncbi:MAG: amidohydrolase family protein [Spirochaetaceae bacterium]|nr:amidohydrolase family protein [Spirochaetaceae bacterium]MCF7948387.1 amidohydrolase family protein [Spirochaetia bacterium]MCF7951277.1 amidohydrolase family protein [Spirochaetaceae bacterium]